MTKANFVWEDPPEPSHSGSRYAATFAALDTNPGKWARIATKETKGAARSTANALRKRYPGYEIVARGRGRGGAVYARLPQSRSSR